MRQLGSASQTDSMRLLAQDTMPLLMTMPREMRIELAATLASLD
jgi:hypothetical protein